MTSIYEPRPKLTSIDFDHWRSRYASTSYDDQVKYHNWIWRDYPVQRHYDMDAALLFFDPLRDDQRMVLEIGGWTGEVADTVLKFNQNIQMWTNVELSRGAVENKVPTDWRYEARVLPNWVWEQPDHFFEMYDVVFMSHSVEHLSVEHLKKLLKKIDSADYLYLDAPLPQLEPTNWKGYNGSHVLQLSWAQLCELLADHGWYQLTSEPSQNPAEKDSTVYTFMRRE